MLSLVLGTSMLRNMCLVEGSIGQICNIRFSRLNLDWEACRRDAARSYQGKNFFHQNRTAEYKLCWSWTKNELCVKVLEDYTLIWKIYDYKNYLLISVLLGSSK